MDEHWVWVDYTIMIMTPTPTPNLSSETVYSEKLPHTSWSRIIQRPRTNQSRYCCLAATCWLLGDL
eukprot:scaffold3912_cov191-Skeletonema_marinoi.AAC.5